MLDFLVGAFVLSIGVIIGSELTLRAVRPKAPKPPKTDDDGERSGRMSIVREKPEERYDSSWSNPPAKTELIPTGTAPTSPWQPPRR